MDNAPLLSIIVPVYNVEKYLHICIDSILEQTLSHFEVLLIDDGSFDQSGNICDDYSKKDSRIKVFHKDNGGVSTARNLGLDNATGDWVIFMDADDVWLDNTILEKMISCTHNADIIRGEYTAIDKDGKKLFEKKYRKKHKLANKDISTFDFITKIIDGEFFLPLCLIKRELTYAIRFKEGMAFLEDILFFSNILKLNHLTCWYIPVRFYGYRKFSNSVSYSTTIKKLADAFSMCDEYFILSANTQDKRLRDYWLENGISLYYRTFRSISNTDDYYKDKDNIIVDLDLNNLHKRVLNKMDKIVFYYKYFALIIPSKSLSLKYLRFKSKITHLKNIIYLKLYHSFVLKYLKNHVFV